MKSLKLNFLYNSIYQILIIILPLITAPYISRVLGPEGIGVYSYTYSIAYYFVLVAMLGVNNYGNRSVARVRDNQEKLNNVFSQIYYLQFSIAIISTITYLFFCLNETTTSRVASLLQIFYVISAAFDITWFFSGLEEFGITVARSIVVKIVTVISIFLFVKDQNDTLIYVFIMSFSILVNQLIVWPFLSKKVKFQKPNLREILSHLKPNLILFIPVVAVSLYKVMDKILLGNMVTVEAVGFYESAEKVINIPMGIITALGTVMLPRTSNLVSQGKNNESLALIRKSNLFVAVLSMAMCSGISSISNNFVPVFFGPGYDQVVDLLIGLSITIPFISCANVIRTQYLIPRSLDKSFITSVISGAIVNLILNLIFIPKYKALGAVIGTIVAEIVVCLIQLISVRKVLKLKNIIKDFFICGLSGAGMYFIVRKISLWPINSILCLILQILLGAISYFIILFFLLLLFGYKNEIKEIFKILKFKRN